MPVQEFSIKLRKGSNRLAYVEHRLGGTIPPAFLNMDILGHRVFIAIDPAEDKTEGGLYLPDVVADRERGGSGWICSIGESVGLGTKAGANYAPYWLDFSDIDAIREEQFDLLGRHVVYGKHSVKALRTSARDREYATDFGLISGADVWAFINDEQDWELTVTEKEQ